MIARLLAWGREKARSSDLAERAAAWLVILVVANAAIALLATLLLVGTGLSPGDAVRSTGPAHVRSLKRPGFEDSWTPMLKAYWQKERTPERGLYEIFFERRAKFQYPPSSLLMLDLVPKSVLGTGDPPVTATFVRALAWPSRILTLLTVLVSAWIAVLGVDRIALSRSPPLARFGVFALVTLLGLWYYPLLKAVELGQVQIVIDALVAIAVLCFLTGREAATGVLVGVCCLLKPQFALVLPWALFRRRFPLLSGATAVVAVGLSVSVWRFGFRDLLDYVTVVRSIARHGEAYWPNQSANGLFNRLLGNGDAIWFSDYEFVPYHPVVHALTVLTTLLLIAGALWPRPTDTPAKRMADFLIVCVAATIASPVAWEHHYGVLLPVFAATLPFVLERPEGRRLALVLGGGYLAVASVVTRPALLYPGALGAVVGAHTFFGGLALYFVLARLRRSPRAINRDNC
jgi:alpha-1,2-mannosyltransferase